MPEATPELEHRLRDRLGGFCRYLRHRGLPVGIGAELDLATAAGAIDLLDREGLRAACGVTLARSPEEVRFVADAFDRYWTLEAGAADRAPPPHEVWALAPPRREEKPERPRRSGEIEVERPPVAIPLGTYSAAAPATGHALREVPARDLRAVRHGARRFRRRLATLPGRRRGPARHGAIDLRATVRRSLRHGGEWVELGRERPKVSRAEFVILWDVSGSMREHETRFFAIVHALLSASRRSRVYAFSTRLEDVTGLVRSSGYRRAVDVVGHRIDRADGGTRIGRALVEFSERFGATLGPATTLVLLSDGWDLGEADLVRDELAHLGRRAGRIVWVTPYTRRRGFEPSVGALRAARGEIDLLLGPEDFESRWPLRPFPL
jgi:uncharacterized protein